MAYGYSILVPRSRPDWAHKNLPARIVSLSNCLKTDLNDVWLDAWREREGDMETVYREAHEHFGMDRTAVDALCLWYQTKPDVDMHAFRTLAAAEEAIRDLLPRGSDVVIVGAGLPRKHVDDLFARGTRGAPDEGSAGISELVLDALRRDQPLEPGGTVLGFEPIVIDGGLACSWLCNGIDRDADEKLGIKTNESGLIERFDDADRVVQYIREDGHAEPGVWLPWLLVRY